MSDDLRCKVMIFAFQKVVEGIYMPNAEGCIPYGD
jgi:hypothetical protein